MTRLLCLSDIHGRFSKFPVDPSTWNKCQDRLPAADAVLIAGDFTNFGMAGRMPAHFQEVFNAEVWMKQLAERYGYVFYVLGNHDLHMAADFFEAQGPDVFSVDVSARAVTTKTRQFGPYRVTGINLSPCFNAPQLARDWTNMTARPEIDQAAFDELPRADIVVSHCPPVGTRDYAGKLWNGTNWVDQHIGSPGLRNYVHTFTPRLVVCGHVHEAVGVEYIKTQVGETCVVNTAQTATLVTIPAEGRVEAEIVA